MFAIELEPGQAAAGADLVTVLGQSALVGGIGRDGAVLRVAVNDATPSAAVSLRAPVTVGTSLVPVIVTVSVWATVAPCASFTS